MSIKRRYFGTDGIRGPYGSSTMCPQFAQAVGTALAAHLRAKGVKHPVVLVGRDTRESGSSLVNALAQGLAVLGARCIDAGVAPTPAIALAIPHMNADAGVAVTASHNPASDNGIKIFSFSALKLPDEVELAIESLIDEALGADTRPAAPMLAQFDAAALYRDKMSAILPANALAGMVVAVDTAHGAASFTTPAVLASYGAEVHATGNNPNGTNINDGCGSEHPEVVCDLARRCSARIGIANDGDADRVILCDEKGEVRDGDEVLALVGLHLLRNGTLAKNTLVATIMSNLGLDEAITAAGGRVVRVDVGDRYILESMLANGYNFGGEASGHIIFKDISTTGDGLLAALQVLGIMAESGRPLSELRRAVRLWPQKKKNAKVRTKIPFGDIPGWNDAIRDIQERLAPGRILVRYSGTEAKIRLLAEAKDEARAQAALDELLALAGRRLELC